MSESAVKEMIAKAAKAGTDFNPTASSIALRRIVKDGNLRPDQREAIDGAIHWLERGMITCPSMEP